MIYHPQNSLEIYSDLELDYCIWFYSLRPETNQQARELVDRCIAELYRRHPKDKNALLNPLDP